MTEGDFRKTFSSLSTMMWELDEETGTSTIIKKEEHEISH